MAFGIEIVHFQLEEGSEVSQNGCFSLIQPKFAQRILKTIRFIDKKPFLATKLPKFSILKSGIL